MSKYMAFETDVFANGELLVAALGELGFPDVIEGENLPLQGWDRKDTRTADIIIRRSAAKNLHLLGDIGFQKTVKGYLPIIDDMDLSGPLGRDFIQRLQTQYHIATAKKMAKKLGGTLLTESVGKTIKIKVRY